MAFQLSPGVQVVEKDFTSIVPAVATSTGAFAGAFQWGPVLEPVTISSENVLVQRFGKPTDANAQSFFTAANFLSYASNLLVVRADTTNSKNATALTTGSVASVAMTTGGTGYTSAPTVTFSAPEVSGGVQATGTVVMSGAGVTGITVAAGGSGYTVAPTVVISAPNVAGGVQAVATAVVTDGAVTAITIGTAGSGYTTAPTVTLTGGDGSNAQAGAVTIGTQTVTGVTVVTAGSGYSSAPTVTFTGGGASAQATATATVISGTGIKIKNTDEYLYTYANGSGVVGEFAAKYPGSLGNSLKVSMADSASFASWAYRNEFDSAPGTSTYAANAGASLDEVHVIVIDEDGKWTGAQGTVLEKYSYLSKASDAKKEDGANNYYRDVLNSRSQYIWWMDHPVIAGSGSDWGTAAASGAYKTLSVDVSRSLVGGVDDLAPTDGQLQNAWILFADDGQYDISLLPLGKASADLAEYVINNVAEARLDCVAFVSPEDITTGDILIGAGSTTTDAIIAYRNLLPSTSYAVMDSGYKYQYDRYNDKYRWVPLNGDIAGLCARTDYQADPWFSPGGLNRGQIKNVVKLSHNPNKTDRDNLYKAGVNPVVTFPGQGTVLYGDKTLLAKPSAFDRINVRRLFIVLEKSIATASKFQLFEFNDGFTRAQFKNIVEPFLRDVQGRRGITDFVVKCDDSNNTGEVIDRNEFVADIFIKPNRSINYITLNFVAARSSIAFSEIGGGI